MIAVIRGSRLLPAVPADGAATAFAVEELPLLQAVASRATARVARASRPVRRSLGRSCGPWLAPVWSWGMSFMSWVPTVGYLWLARSRIRGCSGVRCLPSVAVSREVPELGLGHL